jgi:hypothetical protein
MSPYVGPKAAAWKPAQRKGHNVQRNGHAWDARKMQDQRGNVDACMASPARPRQGTFRKQGREVRENVPNIALTRPRQESHNLDF